MSRAAGMRSTSFDAYTPAADDVSVFSSKRGQDLYRMGQKDDCKRLCLLLARRVEVIRPHEQAANKDK